jgi:hypothetical protein
MLGLTLVLATALATRLVFAQAAPVLLMGDSETYLGPAVDLVQGAGLDLSLKRTPGYPLFLAAALGAFGEDLHGVAAAQHGLGIVTALLAFLLGLRIAGLGAGLAAGVSTALAGNLLVYERLVMSESLFTTLLACAVTSLVMAGKHGSWRWFLVGGLALGGATLVRPVAQALLVLVPIAAFLAPGARRRLIPSVLAGLLGFCLVLVPWSLWNSRGSDDASIGALGQTLVGRTARHDRRNPAANTGFIYFDPARDANEPDATRLAVRQILQQAAERGSSGRAVHTRIRRELGLSEAAADRLMRDLALEAIRDRWDYYLLGTTQRFLRLWATSAERLSGNWNDQETIRRAWEHEPSAELIDRLTFAPDRLPRGEAIASAVQPSRLGAAYLPLFLLGTIAALVDRRYRLALIPAVCSVILIALSAALVGGVSRYRYPVDPLIAVVAGAGLTWAFSTLRWFAAPRLVHQPSGRLE